MEIIYGLVLFSLFFSLGFLRLFFWAVDSDQFRAMDTAALTLFEDEDEVCDEQ